MSDASWPTFAGHACASHVGHMVEVDGLVGRLFRIEHDEAYSTVRLLLGTSEASVVPVAVPPDAVIALAPRGTPHVLGRKPRECR